MKRGTLMFVLLFVVCIAATVLFGGCATAPCMPAEEVMREKGVVLECKRVTMYEGERVTRCLIIPKKYRWDEKEYFDHAVWKTVFKRHCGQYNE